MSEYSSFYMVMAIGKNGPTIKANLQRAIDLDMVFEVEVSETTAEMLAVTCKAINDQFLEEGLIVPVVHEITGEEEHHYTKHAERLMRAREN